IGMYVGEINGSGSVIESTTSKGVHIVHLKDFIGTSRVSVAKINQVSAPEKQHAVDWALSRIGYPYDYWLISKQVDNDAYYCSELIWASYQQIGIELDKNPGFSLKFAYAVAPQELFGDDDVIIYHINNTVKDNLIMK
ncbi:MAG: hypothetical protein GXP45_08235, partial [bacterium]|nr:hypothetical protein [bacterium]